jgi:hypothetical protein
LTAGGFKSRPALVKRVLEDQGRYAVEVCYGTSKIRTKVRGVGSFVIAKYQELLAIGLYHNTRFELLTTQLLPWAEETFPHAPGKSSPVMGRLTQHQKVRLQMWSKMTKNVIEALEVGEDGDENGSKPTK